MSGLTRKILHLTKDVWPVLASVPGIRPNFSDADLTTTAAVIRVLVEKGVDTLESIYAYLNRRNCPHDLATIRFLLDAYAGLDRRQCLWFKTTTGSYVALN